MKYKSILEIDKKVGTTLLCEDTRQSEGLELIPSENYISKAVQEALCSSMTNKYAEGYPGKRYYGGQTFTDAIELLAIKRACKLFKCKYANVQPLSGSPANMAVYFALLQPGDTILSMDLTHGGHLTHGHPTSIVSKIFNFVHYKMKDISTGEIDYDEMRQLAIKHKPKMILAGFSSYPRTLDYKKFVDIAKEVDAITVVDIAHIAGLIAGGVLKNPFSYGFDVMTTTTHKTLRGPRGGMILVRESKEFIEKINKAVFPGLQGGPHMNNIAAKAIAFKEANTREFKKYSKQILLNAQCMADAFKSNNVEMITGGTSNHLILIDTIKSFNLTGKEAEVILDSISITVNKNILPDDTRSSHDPSGIRLGTPAITSRGFKLYECQMLADIITDALHFEQTFRAHKITLKKYKKIMLTLKNRVAYLASSYTISESY